MSVDIQGEMADIIGKLKDIFEAHRELEPKTAIQAAKELRGYLTDLEKMTHGGTDDDDVELGLVMQVVKAVKKVGRGRNSGRSFGDGPWGRVAGSEGEQGYLESGEVRGERAEILQEPEETERAFAFNDQSGPPARHRAARHSG